MTTSNDFDWTNVEPHAPYPMPLDEQDLQELLDWGVPFPHELSRAHAAAFGVLVATMGREWTVTNEAFLNPDPRDNDFERVVARIIQTIVLGESLYNLQSTRGYPTWRAGLRGSTIEAFYGEVLGARHLANTGLPFTFVRPRRSRRTYDARILRGARGFPIEFKGKLPTTEATTRTVLASLKSAKKQLPRQSPGLVLLTVPQTWQGNPLAWMNILAATNEFFRNTTRVAAVCVSWDIVVPQAPDGPIGPHDVSCSEIRASEAIPPRFRRSLKLSHAPTAWAVTGRGSRIWFRRARPAPSCTPSGASRRSRQCRRGSDGNPRRSRPH